MSQWAGGVLTAAGRALQAKVETGTTLTLTKIKLGDGTESMSAVDSLVDLVSPKAELGISSATSEGDVATITGVMSATLLSAGFYAREWGLFAQDPDVGEILYMITIDAQPEWLPASTEAAQVSATYAMNIAVANATNIEVNIDPAGLVDVEMLDERMGVAERSKVYSVGDLGTLPGLPAEHYLKCITAGTTGATTPVIPSGVQTGDRIADGTVTWLVMNVDAMGVPVGYITPFLQSDAPEGWLSCAGAEVSRAAYPDLWNFVNGSSQLISESDWQAKNTSGEKNIGWFSTGDGTTTFRLPRIVGSGELTEVKRFTTAGAGSFTAPVTGIYRITLQGAGGGGGGAGKTNQSGMRGGGGGGQGGHLEFYEKMTAGQSYSFTIGAGGAGGAAGDSSTNGARGSNGGMSQITINDITYTAAGGVHGSGQALGTYSNGGAGGAGRIGNTIVCYGAAGTPGNSQDAQYFGIGGTGGGAGGAISGSGENGNPGHFGGGGSGGTSRNASTNYAGGAGGDGYIEFAFNPVPQYWYVRAFGSATNQGTIDITELANMLNAKLSISSVPLVAGFNAKQTFTSSGSFTAPVTGIYKITLQGGGGGGGGAATAADGVHGGGGGGGQGAHLEFYEKLTAGTTYSYTIGAGGAGGSAGSSTSGSYTNSAGEHGGDSSITVNNNAYVAGGGRRGLAIDTAARGGMGGTATINDTAVAYGAPGSSGSSGSTCVGGGSGGGPGAGNAYFSGKAGCGGGGGEISYGGTYNAGYAGGNGYITFEWQTGSLA